MVKTEEVGVVLTFGKYSHQADPGLRVKWPWPFQTVMAVPVQRQLKAEFGFRTVSAGGAGVRSQYSEGRYTGESEMLTGDLNVAVVEWTTQFRITRRWLDIGEGTLLSTTAELSSWQVSRLEHPAQRAASSMSKMDNSPVWPRKQQMKRCASWFPRAAREISAGRV